MDGIDYGVFCMRIGFEFRYGCWERVDGGGGICLSLVIGGKFDCLWDGILVWMVGVSGWWDICCRW